MRSYNYVRYMRDGTTQKRTGVVRSRTEGKRTKKEKRNVSE